MLARENSPVRVFPTSTPVVSRGNPLPSAKPASARAFDEKAPICTSAGPGADPDAGPEPASDVAAGLASDWLSSLLGDRFADYNIALRENSELANAVGSGAGVINPFNAAIRPATNLRSMPRTSSPRHRASRSRGVPR